MPLPPFLWSLEISEAMLGLSVRTPGSKSRGMAVLPQGSSYGFLGRYAWAEESEWGAKNSPGSSSLYSACSLPTCQRNLTVGPLSSQEGERQALGMQDCVFLPAQAQPPLTTSSTSNSSQGCTAVFLRLGVPALVSGSGCH